MSVYVRLEWQALACVLREHTQCFLRELLGLLRPELATPPPPHLLAPLHCPGGGPSPDSEMCAVVGGWGLAPGCEHLADTLSESGWDERDPPEEWPQ